MEVDLNPSSPSPSSSSNNGSNRSSPFAFVAAGSSGPSFASVTSTLTAEGGASGPAWTSSSRKRRRSSGTGGDGSSSSSSNLPCRFLQYQEFDATASENRYEHRSVSARAPNLFSLNETLVLIMITGHCNRNDQSPEVDSLRPRQATSSITFVLWALLMRQKGWAASKANTK